MREVRSSGVRGSITIMHIRKFFKSKHNIVRFRFFPRIANRSMVLMTMMIMMIIVLIMIMVIVVVIMFASSVICTWSLGDAKKRQWLAICKGGIM